jgi:Trypsin
VDVPVVSDADCREAYGDEDMWDNMICAGYSEGGKDSCNVSKLSLENFSQHIRYTRTYVCKYAGVIAANYFETFR